MPNSWFESSGVELTAAQTELLRLAQRTLEGNVLYGPQFPWHPLRGICPSATSFPGIWNWDAAFHVMTVSRWNPALAREQVDVFLNTQLPTGGFIDVVFSAGEVVKDFGKPPVLPWAEEIVDRRAPDETHLRRCYDAFRRNLEFWNARRRDDERGLYFYDADRAEPRARDQGARYESGWDNAVRWDEGIANLLPVDLNCFAVMMHRSLAYMAARLGRPAEAGVWLREADALGRRANACFWNEQAGCYFDYNRTEGRLSRVLSPASFMPLYVRIAEARQAAAMAAIAADPQKMYPGMPTVSYDDPQYSDAESAYWRGPTWLNVAYFALKGLLFYGHDRVATACRDEILSWCGRDGEPIRENYSRNGGGLKAENFSWSAAFVIEFILNWRSTDLY